MNDIELVKELARLIDDDYTISFDEAWSIAEDLADREITESEWKSLRRLISIELNNLN